MRLFEHNGVGFVCQPWFPLLLLVGHLYSNFDYRFACNNRDDAEYSCPLRGGRGVSEMFAPFVDDIELDLAIGLNEMVNILTVTSVQHFCVQNMDPTMLVVQFCFAFVKCRSCFCLVV